LSITQLCVYWYKWLSFINNVKIERSCELKKQGVKT
jgi:hypothetical protein